MQAARGVAFFVFITLNVVAVVRPDDVTVVAIRFGIGSGADVVLYLLVVALILGVLNTYMRFRETDRRFTEPAATGVLGAARLPAPPPAGTPARATTE
jgi:hypothetical protein